MLERLHDLLLGPVAEAGVLAESGRIIVVPHDALVYLPFAALRDHGSGRYLVEDHALIHAVSAAGLVGLRRRGERYASDAAAVMAPFPGALPASLDEARAVAGRAGTRPIAGPDADEPALRLALERSRRVHVATHGVMNPVNPMFSRIEVSDGPMGSEDDGRLEVHELLTLSVASELVFLSGCETAVGATWSTDFARGEDYTTLAQALLSAGAGNVVATLWRLDDPGAARFAERFYLELERHPPVEALSRTQQAMITDGRYASPFYWAPYQITGSG